MSRLFDDASTHYLEYAGAVLTAAPITMACWFRSDNTSDTQTLISIGRSGTANNYFRLAAAGATGGDPIQATAKTGAGAQTAASATGYSANVWTHAAAVFGSDTSRFAYINGTPGAENTTSRAPSGCNVTNVGVLTENTRSLYMSGAIAEAAIWNVALDAGEIAALARGVRTRRIRPASLVAYWPLWGTHSTEIDLAGGLYPMTVTGATATNHAPVVPSSARWWGSIPHVADAAPASAAAWYYREHVLRRRRA